MVIYVFSSRGLAHHGGTPRPAIVRAPRGPDSSSLISFMVRSLGAPVIDPHGNNARKMSDSLVSGSISAVTSEVSWWTVS